MELIAEGKLMTVKEGEALPCRSEILEKYLRTVRESAERNEWKYSGEGAKFTGSYRGDADGESAVKAVNYRFRGIAREAETGDLLYTLSIDNTSGLYQRPEEGGDEGILLSERFGSYREIAECEGNVLVTVEQMGECHVGVIEKGSRSCRILTEGESRESSPAWSKSRPGQFYYSSAGLESLGVPEEERKRPNEDFRMMGQMYLPTVEEAPTRRKGPAGIYRMSLNDFTIEELLYDEKYDYLCPVEDGEGALWFIRRPYQAGKESGGRSFFTLLKDIVLFPFRMIRALVGFFNVFSMKYSGKTIRSGDVKAKNVSERERFVMGNLINAEEEMKKNREKGDAFPGYVPGSYELCRRKNGETEKIAGGVGAFALAPDGVYLSNGAYLLKMKEKGKVEKVCRLEGITAIVP